MKIYKYPTTEEIVSIAKRSTVDSKKIEPDVKKILNDVKKNGDSALRKYTEKFDRVKIRDLEVSESEITSAESKCSPILKKAIKTATQNIYKFHKSQKKGLIKVQITKGITCYLKYVPIEKIGLYIPGGTAPLFSTVLMLGIPASLAGCRDISLFTPPKENGEIHPAILYSAKQCGIKKIYRSGGVQAIGAMAYGTETIRKVDKIFGPGNKFVTEAKKLVSLENTAIDLPAGPSELAIIIDETSNPDYAAADAISQAEHDTESQILIVSTDEVNLYKTLASINRQIKKLPRREIAKRAMKQSKAVLVQDINDAINIINDYAPEHLSILTKNCDQTSLEIKNAGSVFLGSYTPESAGDYASGTNHVLPTGGYAKTFGGVTIDSFMKTISIQKITKRGLEKIGKCIEVMAEAEGLEGHKRAVSIRTDSKLKTG